MVVVNNHDRQVRPNVPNILLLSSLAPLAGRLTKSTQSAPFLILGSVLRRESAQATNARPQSPKTLGGGSPRANGELQSREIEEAFRPAWEAGMDASTSTSTFAVGPRTPPSSRCISWAGPLINTGNPPTVVHRGAFSSAEPCGLLVPGLLAAAARLSLGQLAHVSDGCLLQERAFH